MRIMVPLDMLNVGINVARGDIIAFIDGDAYPPKDWLGKIVAAFTGNDRLAVLGGIDFLVFFLK